jgi:transketolase
VLSLVQVIYDDNHISIDGPTSLSFSEDVPMRFRAYGFDTIAVAKGDDDLSGLLSAIEQAKKNSKPTLISVRTTIGFGSSKAGTAKTHGEALGAEDIKHVKKAFGFDPEQSFVVPAAVTELWNGVQARGAAQEAEWNKLFAAYEAAHPQQAQELKDRFSAKIPSVVELVAKLPKYDGNSKADATRNMSGTVLNAVADLLPAVIGGSADLTPSNKTDLKKSHDFLAKSYDGRYIRFGIREHGMAAIGNGLVAYGGFIPYTATFLNFIEYAFPAVRLAALSNFKQLFVMTHDSIGLGEDGPTHQPVEALQLCRATPNVLVLRPADGAETVGAYAAALHWEGPSVLALSRQNVHNQANSSAEKVLKGAYVLVEEDKSRPLQLVVIASGTEVTTVVEALKTNEQLKALNVRVVSAPSTTLFDKQSVEYRRSVLPLHVPTVSVEASAVFGWEKYAHASVGMTTFGASGPLEKVLDKFHMSVRTLPEALLKRAGQIDELAKINGGKPPVLNTHVELGYPTHHDVHA